MKKIISVMMAVVMLFIVCVVPASAAEAESPASIPFRGAFWYRPGDGEFTQHGDSIDYYVYSDDYFRAPSYDFNAHLASMSMAVAVSSVGSSREPFTPAGYANTSRNIRAILEDLGFGEIEVNTDYTVKPTKDSVGAACGHKELNENGESYTLLTIIPRSAGYEAEWGNNFVLGAVGDAAGFSAAADKVLAFARDYVRDKQLTGAVKVWTVGYSRGGAIANLIARKLIDDPHAYLGDAVELSPENLYAYTFGTPSAADPANHPRGARYRGIFNSFSDAEIASLLAPVEMGFTRYGTDRIINTATKRERMYELLGVCNQEVLAHYSASASPELFRPKKIVIKDGSVSMAVDEDSYIPAQAAEFLRGLSAYLTLTAGGRKGYAADYEQPLSDLIAYYESRSAEQRAAFVKTLKENKDTLSAVAAMYAYYMKDSGSASAAADAGGVLSQTGALGELDLGFWDISAILLQCVGYMFSDVQTIHNKAADCFSSALTAGMSASGATDEQIAAVTDHDASLALTHLLSHLLLGNIWQSGERHAFDLNNEQMKNAATLIGNFENLFMDHMNEVLISWLRVDDSYYDTYAPMNDDQRTGYRRVRLSADSAFSGWILNAKDEKVAVLRDGILAASADPWIGFTTTDDGGFLRIPSGKDYRIAAVPDAGCELVITVDEYSVYEASAERVFAEVCRVPAGAGVNIMLPALGSDYSAVVTDQPEKDDPSALVLGDCDGDGSVTILDATCIQRSLADLPNIAFYAEAADADGDGTVSVTDATRIQRVLSRSELRGNVGILPITRKR